MKHIEVEPMPMTGLEFVEAIAEPFADIIAKRNNFEADGQAYDVSKSLVLPSDFIPDEETRALLREEQQAHTAYLYEIGVDVGNLPKIALMGNVLTEWNLPQYQAKMLGGLYMGAGNKGDAVGLFADWFRTWTAEESFHEMLLRDGGQATGVLAPRELDLALIHLQTKDLGLDIETIPELPCYLSPQEGATVISHKNTAPLFGPRMREDMEDVAKNEATHCFVNTKLVGLGLQVAPEHTIQVLYRRWRNFAMPGKEGIRDYDVFTEEMAIAGIFDFVALRKLMRETAAQLGIEKLELSGRSAWARDELVKFIDDGSRLSRRLDGELEARREARIAEAASRGVVPFILGRTVEAPRGEPLRRVA